MPEHTHALPFFIFPFSFSRPGSPEIGRTSLLLWLTLHQELFSAESSSEGRRTLEGVVSRKLRHAVTSTVSGWEMLRGLVLGGH